MNKLEKLEKELREREERVAMLIDEIDYYDKLLENEYWKIEKICEKISKLKCVNFNSYIKIKWY